MKIILLAVTFCIACSTYAQIAPLQAGVYKLDSLKALKKSVSGSTTDLKALSMHSSVLLPGKINHTQHALSDREEIIIVKEGQLKVNINDSSKLIGAGGIVMIAAGDSQSFENVSDKPVTYYVLGFTSTLPVNIERGKKGGGTFMKDWNELTVKKTDKGESRPVFDRPSSMFERFEVHVTSLNAGFESHPPHQHRQEEIMFLTKGNVTMHIGETNYNASAGDVIFVTPNILHNLKNTGTEQCSYFAIKWYNTLAP